MSARPSSTAVATPRAGWAVALSAMALGLSLGAAPASAQATRIDFEDALRSMTLLGPEAFPELPVHVARALERRGCAVPQSWLHEEPHNVVRGSFLGAGSQAWAVLCSVADTSSILVFPGEPGAAPMALARSADLPWIQGIGRGEAGYSRVLAVSSEEEIAERHRRYGREAPLPPLDHEGIEDVFAEKASTVWYRHDGLWLELPGADQ